jgi:hypothetical protein
MYLHYSYLVVGLLPSSMRFPTTELINKEEGGYQTEKQCGAVSPLHLEDVTSLLMRTHRLAAQPETVKAIYPPTRTMHHPAALRI